MTTDVIVARGGKRPKRAIYTKMPSLVGACSIGWRVPTISSLSCKFGEDMPMTGPPISPRTMDSLGVRVNDNFLRC